MKRKTGEHVHMAGCTRVETTKNGDFARAAAVLTIKYSPEQQKASQDLTKEYRKRHESRVVANTITSKSR